MDDVWCAPGVTRETFEEFVQALLPRRDPRPLVLAAVIDHGHEAELIAASETLFRLFAAVNADELSQRLLHGLDPGANRLAVLSRSLPLNGAPRLERLRFFLGPGTEIMTFLCRRITAADDRPVFLAAALGLRPDLIPAPSARPAGRLPASSLAPAAAGADRADVTAARPLSGSVTAMTIQTIHATLRSRWPSSRTARFLWQTDAAGNVTLMTSPLAEIVGEPNARLVGRNLLEVAPLIDPSGRFAQALSSHATWSRLDVAWPITDARAAITVGLGAIAMFDREHRFEGYRGYGVACLDKIVERAAIRLFQTAGAMSPAVPSPLNVVRFPGGAKVLSPEDKLRFDELGAELRDQTGIPDAPRVLQAVSGRESTDHRSLPSKQDADDGAKRPADPASKTEVVYAEVGPMPHDSDKAASQRNVFAVLDRLAVGLLVSRDNVPIFANRHLLQMLDFAAEDDLHRAGGMAHLFGGTPSNASGSEAVAIRSRDGSIIPANVRMQSLDWDGLPATLLTVQASPEPQPVEPIATPSETVRPSGVDDAERRELRAILETATDGVVVFDANGNVMSLNRSGEALFGCDRGAVIGRPFLDLFAPHNQSLAAEYLEGLKSSATKSLFNDGRELLVQAHRGGPIPVFMTLGRLGSSDAVSPDEAADTTRFCALFRDLTHWKKVEQDLESARQQAERSSALKTDFLAKVSHEIRTPLNAIIGFAEVMMEERFGPVGGERYKEYLRDIHASGTHVLSLVNDLLDLSKIEAGKMELAVETIDVNKVVNACVSLMQPQASRERVILRLSLAAVLPQIKADERSVRQIVLNLLSNAVKFNEPGGQVIVATASTDSGHVVIRIRDTGPGMSEANIAAALEPFRQLSTDRPTEGTGLGLPLTKALAEANQAAFTIKSKVDHGTLVEVAFPPARVLAS